jgi:hypothetical protein
MGNFMRKLDVVTRPLGAVLLVATVSAGAGAQQSPVTAPWRAWTGCWSAGAVSAPGSDTALPIVCITPGSSANVVQITTLADGKVISTQRVDASGREVPLDAKGCTGTETGQWSADGRRVYLTASATCDGVVRTTHGILAITPQGEWLDVQGVRAGGSAGGSETVRVARYRDIGLRSGVPAEIADAIADTRMAVESARAAAAAPIGTMAVGEAARATSVDVAEAFVLERGQAFPLNASQLVALADAGMSPRLTDAMIAVSNPETFAVRRPEMAVRDTMSDAYEGRRVYVTLDRYMSPFGWGYGPYGYSRYGYGYDPYGYNSYGSGYGGYGYGGYGYPGYVYGGGPVVIVRGSDAAQPHGRVVKGHGYEQGGPPGGGNGAVERANSSRNSSPSSENSGNSNSRGSSTSGERTAKPRP